MTQLLVSWKRGNQDALGELMPLVYRELRRRAGSYLRRERSGHTLSPTALVHETYLQLVDQTLVDCGSRAQFFAMSANLMRQILVHHAERRLAAKRGGGRNVPLEEAGSLVQQPRLDMIALDDALKKLARIDQRQSRIVELRFFGGLTEEEVADLLEVSMATVKRDWRIAKAVLWTELRSELTLLS